MKVFVAVVVIAAFCAVLSTAVSDEQNEASIKKLESDKEGVNAAVANLTELKDTWGAEFKDKISPLRSNTLLEITQICYGIYWNIIFLADGKYASNCIDAASDSFTQVLSDAVSALDETQATALNSTYIQETIDSGIQYGNVVIRQLDSTLEHLDCLVYEPDTPDYCLVLDESELDMNIHSFYDEVSRINSLTKDFFTSAYSTASEANAKTTETARGNAKSVEETATECIAAAL